MEQKNILLISGSFYPMNSPRSFRTTNLAKEFSKQGHKVVVYIPNRSTIHDEFEKEHNIEIKNLGNRSLGINISKGFEPWLLFKRFLGRLLLFLFNYPSISLMFLTKEVLKRETRKFDLLISVAVPHSIHWGVAWAWRLGYQKSDTWVADCGDPFVGVSYEKIKKPFYFNYLENSFLKRCDFISVPFKNMVQFFNKNYDNKFIVIPQGFDFSEVNIQGNYSKNEIPTFIYSGTIMPGLRDPLSLINYLEKSKRKFKFIIYTKQKSPFLIFENLLGTSLIIKDYVTRNELIMVLSRADFLVNVNTDSNDNEGINAIPSKLIDYTFSERPILSYSQNNLDIKTILEFLDGEYGGAFKVEKFEDYQIESVAQKFINLT